MNAIALLPSCENWVSTQQSFEGVALLEHRFNSPRNPVSVWTNARIWHFSGEKSGFCTAALEDCGERSTPEQAVSDLLGFPEDIRLGCQTQVFGDVCVRRLALDGDGIEAMNAESVSTIGLVQRNRWFARGSRC